MTETAASPPALTLHQEIAERAGDFVGRAWLLNAVADWADRGPERFLIVTAEPGFGKTAFAAWVAGAGPAPSDPADAARLARLRGFWSAAHFCVARVKEGTVRAEEFALELARQLQARLPDYDAAIFRQPGVTVNASLQALSVVNSSVALVKIGQLVIPLEGAQQVYHRAVRQPLAALEKERSGLKVFILVDALDEALAADPPTIVDLLAGSDDFPAGVRFLLTCRRNEARALGAFPGARVLDMSGAGPTKNDGDIRAYVEAHPVWRQWLAAQAAAPAATLNDLVERAEGNFLYVSFLLEEVRISGRSLDQLQGLPRGLDGLYRAYLRRLVPERHRPTDPDPWLDEYGPLLGRLCVAEPAAPAQTLPDWLSWDGTTVGARLKTVQQVTEYLPDDGGGWRLYHRSMAEFLTTTRADDLNPFFVDAGQQHGLIARFYRDQFAGYWHACDAYGLRRLVRHLKAALDAERLPRARQQKARELYDTVLDRDFRASQIEHLGDSTATLADLRLALTQALAEEDLLAVLECVAAYQDTLRGSAVSRAVFAVLDAGDFDAALRRAQHYAVASGWNRVLYCYLAWEAAARGQAPEAKRAAEAARAAPLASSASDLDDLCAVLMWRAALALEGSEAAADAMVERLTPVDSYNWKWTAKYLRDIPMVGREELPQALERLKSALAPTDADEYEGVSRAFVEAEVMAGAAAEIRDAFIRVAGQPEGRAELEGALATVAGNPYPFYRDRALCALATVCALVPDHAWVWRRLREVLEVALDREGAVFTFDVPTMLLDEAERLGVPAPALRARLGEALADPAPWGTRMRALGARAALAFSRGKLNEAFADLTAAEGIRSGFAGFSVLHLLSLASRCLEFGVLGPSGLVAQAQVAACHVQNSLLRTHREKLVEEYRRWEMEPLPDPGQAADRAAAFTDLDARLVYLDQVTARYDLDGTRAVALIKTLVPLALGDRTALDTLLGRLLRRRPGRWDAPALDRALAWCNGWLDAPHRGGPAGPPR
jgi:hypothetical protein